MGDLCSDQVDGLPLDVISDSVTNAKATESSLGF